MLTAQAVSECRMSSTWTSRPIQTSDSKDTSQLSSIGLVRDTRKKATNGNTTSSQLRVCILGQAIMRLLVPPLSCCHARLRYTRSKNEGQRQLTQTSSLKHKWNLKNVDDVGPNSIILNKVSSHSHMEWTVWRHPICVEHRKLCLWQQVTFSLGMSTHRCVSLLIYSWEFGFFPWPKTGTPGGFFSIQSTSTLPIRTRSSRHAELRNT